MSALYLRKWSAATRRSNNSTPDIFASRRLKILGIRRAFTKLGASPVVDLEKLNAQELEQLRVEIAAQLSFRKSGIPPWNNNKNDSH